MDIPLLILPSVTVSFTPEKFSLAHSLRLNSVGELREEGMWILSCSTGGLFLSSITTEFVFEKDESTRCYDLFCIFHLVLLGAA